MKIKICYHVSAYPGWQDLVERKIQLMNKVGLWQAASQVRFQLHYPGSDLTWIKNKFANDSRVVLWECPDSHRPWGESYSIIDLREYSVADPEPHLILYYQTKGISHIGKPTEPISQAWTDYLDYWNIEQWRLTVHLITKAGYETAGCNWHPIWDSTVLGHYSGNIWWGSSEFIKRTQPLQKPHLVNFQCQLGGFSTRHDAELWISTGRPKHVTLHQFEHAVVYHVEPPRPKDYRLE